MTQEAVLHLGRQCLWVTVEVAGPLLAVGLIVGVIVSVFQAATQVQEQSLLFVPKMAALMAVLLLCGGWMMTRLIDFTRGLITSLPDYVR